MAQLLDSSGASAAVGRSLGRWLCGGDFVTTEPEAPEETPEPAWRGPLGFPRDWPAVYTSSRCSEIHSARPTRTPAAREQRGGTGRTAPSAPPRRRRAEPRQSTWA
ncbi:unnamed protein product [Prorocentrum cordatum]|uniref:Uncharacterized protein n=1 Tax=Prorocentrum cordatum TaxID=2364126 RepID=A0ABN9R507_9DINO|nr:unnamed protein product [Polarella glacialis]